MINDYRSLSLPNSLGKRSLPQGTLSATRSLLYFSYETNQLQTISFINTKSHIKSAQPESLLEFFIFFDNLIQIFTQTVKASSVGSSWVEQLLRRASDKIIGE